MIKKHIPNALTCFNLLSGCIGITFAFSGELKLAVMFIWIGGAFDFLDGFVARMLKVSSAIGQQLDSLADMITFSLLPAIIMYHFMLGVAPEEYLSYFAFLLAVFSALRLAKFNIDERQSDVFYGLPTPAMALFISAFPYILKENPAQTGDILTNFWALAMITILLSALMVADIKLLALKFKGFQWNGNKMRYLLIMVSVLLIFWLKLAALPLIIIFYVILSMSNNYLEKSV
mgnify:CR=1 FL=1